MKSVLRVPVSRECINLLTYKTALPTGVRKKNNSDEVLPLPPQPYRQPWPQNQAVSQKLYAPERSMPLCCNPCLIQPPPKPCNTSAPRLTHLGSTNLNDCRHPCWRCRQNPRCPDKCCSVPCCHNPCCCAQCCRNPCSYDPCCGDLFCRYPCYQDPRQDSCCQLERWVPLPPPCAPKFPEKPVKRECKPINICPPKNRPWIPLLIGLILGGGIVGLYNKYGCYVYKTYIRKKKNKKESVIVEEKPDK